MHRGGLESPESVHGNSGIVCVDGRVKQKGKAAPVRVCKATAILFVLMDESQEGNVAPVTGMLPRTGFLCAQGRPQEHRLLRGSADSRKWTSSKNCRALLVPLWCAHMGVDCAHLDASSHGQGVAAQGACLVHGACVCIRV